MYRTEVTKEGAQYVFRAYENEGSLAVQYYYDTLKEARDHESRFLYAVNPDNWDDEDDEDDLMDGDLEDQFARLIGL